MTVKIFVSHSSVYRDLAARLKLSLLALESELHLDIRVSEEMAGGKAWRRWIDENVQTSDIFLLLYPHAAMEMGWCNYELGRFHVQEGGRPVVCIKNTDITEPPPAFEPYQAYDADVEGLTKFLRELFAKGELTGGKVLNAGVGNPTSEFHKRAREVATELAKHFAQARVREHFYERRLVISLARTDREHIDRDASMVRGNTEGLHLLGLNDAAAVRWSTLQAQLGENGTWLQELEQAIATIPTGALPPTLSPFRAGNVLYIPLVVKAESADSVLREMVLIFVPTNADRLLPLLGWSFPRGMPDRVKSLLHLVRMMFRARWDILEPRYQEARFKRPTTERCAELAQLVLDDYDEMQRESEAQGNSGLDRFNETFHKDLRGEVSDAAEAWLQATAGLRQAADPSPEQLAALLKTLLQNNGHWLSLASRQFMHVVEDLS
jgi:hypothetical protein